MLHVVRYLGFNKVLPLTLHGIACYLGCHTSIGSSIIDSLARHISKRLIAHLKNGVCCCLSVKIQIDPLLASS